MAITHVASGFASGTRLLCTVDLTGQGHQAGDLFLYEAVHSDNVGNHTPPAGVTRLSAAAGFTAAAAQSQWGGFKVLTGSETTLDFVFDHIAGSGTAVGWTILRGCAETTFTVGTNYKEISTGSAATTIVTAAIDVPAGGTLVSMAAVDGTAASNYTLSAGTERFDGEGLTSTFLAVAGYTEDIPAGETGATRTFTYGTAFPQGAVSFVVTPAGAGGGDPAVDTNASIDVGEDFRVRFEIQETAGAATELTGLRLFYSKNGAAYQRATTSTDLRIIATSAYADGDATTDLMTGSSGTFVAGAGDEDGEIAGPLVIPASGHTEVEWSLEIFTATEGDTFDLKVYRADDSPLESYGAVPRITAVLAPTDPAIGLSPTSLSFNATEGGGDPADKSVTITNTGAGTLAWSVSDDAAWLTCTPASGSLAADAFETLTVSPATGALTAGTYNATITITDAAATNSPQTVAVTFNVTVVSGFPVAMEGVYFETSGFAGPHIDANGNLYIDTEAPNTVPTTQEQEEHHIQKSTDGGHTWIYDVDGANSPLSRDLESLSTVLDSNGLLHLAHQKSGYNTYYNQYRTSAHATSPDTWGPVKDENITGAQSGITDQSVSIAVRSDGSVVAFYIATNKDLAYKIRSAGGTWGSEVIVLNDTDYQQVFVDLSKQDDTVHFAYGNYIAKTLHYNTLSPSNVLGTAQQIASGVITEHKPMVNRGLMVYDNAGVDHVYIAWCRQSDHHVLGVEIIAGTPSADEAVSGGVAVYVNPPNMLNNQAVAALSYDQATGTAHVVFADASTHDIWRTERPLGGAWSTPEEIIDAVDCEAISCNVLQYPSGGDKVLGLYYDVDVGVPSGGQMYYSEWLLETGGTTISPAGLAHTRAQGAPHVNPQLLPAGQTHTRAQGAPRANPQLRPASLTRTRTLGTTYIAPRPAALVHTRALGSPVVSPQLRPAAQSHTRAQGSLTVSPQLRPTGLAHSRTLGTTAVVVRIAPSGLAHTRAQGAPRVNPKLLPAGLAHSRAQGTITVAVGFFLTPASLTHTRAQGSPLVNPQVRPSGLAHTRVLGVTALTTPSVRQLGNLIVTVAWVPRPTGLTHTRVLGDPTAHGRATITLDGQEHTRTQGNPTLSARVLPASQTRTRLQGSPSVNPRTVSPTSITRTRAQGATTVTILWIARLDAIVHTRAVGTTTIRGRLILGPASLERARIQGTPILSGRALPASLTHTRTLGAPAVNVRQLAPLALARA